MSQNNTSSAEDNNGAKGREVPAILLAGGRPRGLSSMTGMIAGTLHEMQKPKVAYIGTANGDSPLFFQMMKRVFIKAGAGKVIFLHLAKKNPDMDSVKKVLLNADVVFLAGGEVEDGMNWLKKHGLVDFIKSLYSAGKCFMGVSAGVIMMGSRWVRWDVEGDDSTSQLFDCLGIIPALFDVHAEDEDWVELKAALRLSGDGERGFGLPSGCMISADSRGTLVNLEKEYIVFVNEGGRIHVL